jgi:hypothetical protein
MELEHTGHFIDGANMRRALETQALRNLRLTVVAGPGDLEQWEVCADVDSTPVPLQIAGRGTDAEDAAASLLSTLAQRLPVEYRLSQLADADGARG